MQVSEEHMNDHFTKFHLEGTGSVLHRFTAPDLGDPHDHPWDFRSCILKGGYREEIFERNGEYSVVIDRLPGDSFEVGADRIHRIIELFEPECWTIITPGEGCRKSGFYQFREDGKYHRFWDEEEFKRYEE